MAALYQALENTILTKSALKKLSYDSMKEEIGKELKIDNFKSETDYKLLQKYHESSFTLFINSNKILNSRFM